MLSLDDLLTRPDMSADSLSVEAAVNTTLIARVKMGIRLGDPHRGETEMTRRLTQHVEALSPLLNPKQAWSLLIALCHPKVLVDLIRKNPVDPLFQTLFQKTENHLHNASCWNAPTLMLHDDVIEGLMLRGLPLKRHMQEQPARLVLHRLTRNSPWTESWFREIKPRTEPLRICWDHHEVEGLLLPSKRPLSEHGVQLVMHTLTQWGKGRVRKAQKKQIRTAPMDFRLFYALWHTPELRTLLASRPLLRNDLLKDLRQRPQTAHDTLMRKRFFQQAPSVETVLRPDPAQVKTPQDVHPLIAW